MKFVALVSGGKDSLYSTLECVRNGHELVACVHLGAPACEIEESYMYQTAASEVLPVLVEECLGVPLILYQRVGTSVNTLLVYETKSEADEVEDLYLALKLAQQKFPDVKGVSSGAILSTYQRVRIEHVCSRLGLTSFSYLWRMLPQQDLLKRMIDDGIEAVLVKTACPPGLVPQKHLNKTIGELNYSGLFQRLHDKFQFHMCGEGGEYESLVLDCPLYKKKLVLDEVDIVETSDGVGSLIIRRCHAEDKPDSAINQEMKEPTIFSTPYVIVPESTKETAKPNIRFLPHFKKLPGGLVQTSEIMGAVPLIGELLTETDYAVQEMLDIFEQLDQVLKRIEATAEDVMFVHLYLSEISHFGSINKHYSNFFGTLLPPSRTCVAVGSNALPGGRRVLLDCLIQCGSGAYLRSTANGGAYATAATCSKSTKLREVLHVQSLSYWAPVCVGPYSQVNTFRSGIHFLAGQIGLKPSSMTLHETWTEQFRQCWTNIARVLDALDGCSVEDLLSCLIYVSASVTDWDLVVEIAQEQFTTNGGVLPGAIDSPLKSIHDGYEDEDTRREMTCKNKLQINQLPLLVVSISEMPVGAEIEIESICCTKKATSCLTRSVTCHTQNLGTLPQESSSSWDCGYEFSRATQPTDDIIVESMSCCIGASCATMCTITATVKQESCSVQFLDVRDIFGKMIREGFDSLKSGGLQFDNVVHIRVYHMTTTCNDGILLRSALAAILARSKEAPPSSIIPVQRISLIASTSKNTRGSSPILAMQLLAIDPVQLDTDIWVHFGRE